MLLVEFGGLYFPGGADRPCVSDVSGALGVHRQRVSWEHDPRDSGYLPENGPSPQALRLQAGQDHRQAAAPQEDLRR